MTVRANDAVAMWDPLGAVQARAGGWVITGPQHPLRGAVEEGKREIQKMCFLEDVYGVVACCSSQCHGVLMCNASLIEIPPDECMRQDSRVHMNHSNPQSQALGCTVTLQHLCS